MRKFGLTGFPLQHSFSKKFFEEKFRREQLTDDSYELFPLPSIESFLPLIDSEPLLCGLNVTIPYKESVIRFLNELDPAGKAIGAVNCIKISNGYLKGFNTDAPAFKESLQQFLTSTPQQTFVLGTGGSSKAVCFVLREMGIPYQVVSRQPGTNTIAYTEVTENMKRGNLFVNTTPLGMFPAVEGFPEIPYTDLGSNDFLFDLVYNPEETEFLKRGKEKGAYTKNGLEMLHLQAEKSWEIWNRNG
jgi:shikimate dehydrogenase